MNASELKLKIFKEIDSFDPSRLQDFYGLLVNFINAQRNEKEWEGLTSEQQEGIRSAINEMDEGKGVSHEDILAKYRKKYSHA